MGKRLSAIAYVIISCFIASVHNTNVSDQSTNFVEGCSKKITKTHLTVLMILVTMIPLTILGNIFVVIVISVTPKLRKNSTYLLLLSLAIADFLVGCVTVPINAKRMYNNRLFCLSEAVCRAIFILEPFLSVASMTHLFSIAVERFLSLKIPFQFKLTVSSVLFYIWVISVWIYAVLWSFLGIFKWYKPKNSSRSILSVIYSSDSHTCASVNIPYYTTVYIVCFGIPSILMMYIYHFVFKTTARHIRQISRVELGKIHLRTKRSKLRQFKTFNTVFIVFLIYMACWLPSFVTIILSFYFKNMLFAFQSNQPFLYELIIIIVIDILPPLNSAMNPFLYVISNRQFRNTAVLFINTTNRCFNHNKVINIENLITPTIISKKSIFTTSRITASTSQP